MACSNISTRFAVVMAMAPPEMPSPVMIATLCTPSARPASVERAIDDRQHGNAESVSHFHQPNRRAIALGTRHPEIMFDAGFGGGAFFLADHADALAAEAAEATHQRCVLAELAIARERREFGDQSIDKIGEVRPLRMARHQRFLPWRQIGVEIVQRLRRLLLDPRNLLADIAAGC